jgi:hypothetical protein
MFFTVLFMKELENFTNVVIGNDRSLSWLGTGTFNKK